MEDHARRGAEGERPDAPGCFALESYRHDESVELDDEEEGIGVVRRVEAEALAKSAQP